MQARRLFRRGMTHVLAMLYLVMFGTLAVGFFSATTVAVQVVENDRRVSLASLSAESGLEFIRYHLWNIAIPHGTPQEQYFPTIRTQLASRLNTTGNMAGKTIGMNDDIISIPANPADSIAVGSTGGRFRATIENLGLKLRVKVVGWGPEGTIARAVQLDYGPAQKASNIFDYGVASKGRVLTDGSARVRGLTDSTKGSVLSTTMTNPIPVEIRGREVSGDLSVTNPNGIVVVEGATVGGETSMSVIYDQHVHKGVQEPEFPTIDTDIFKPYATNTYVPGMTTLVNCVIPPNTNPSFPGSVTIQGVLYVQTPNVVTFRGNTSIQGVIVVENNATGTYATNLMDFRGDITAQGVQTLPESFGDLRKLTGAFLLAPDFHVRFSGNFGRINGHILADKNTFDGGATGVIEGSIINMEDTQMTVKGSAELVIASTGTMNYPAGVFFSTRFTPLPDTYEEVQP